MENEVDYGLNTPESFAQFDPDTWLLKTCQYSLLGDSTTFSGALPKSGTMQSGKLFQLAPLEHLTKESDSGWLPTPTKSIGKKGWGMAYAGRNRYSPQVIAAGLAFGYKPPLALLTWMMGYPERYTEVLSNALETPSSPNASKRG